MRQMQVPIFTPKVQVILMQVQTRQLGGISKASVCQEVAIILMAGLRAMLSFFINDHYWPTIRATSNGNLANKFLPMLNFDTCFKRDMPKSPGRGLMKK